MRDTPPFAVAFDAVFLRLAAHVEGASARETAWPEQVAAAIRAGFEFAAENPGDARSLTNDALVQGREGIAHHRRMLRYGVRLLEPGRDQRPENSRLPKLLELALAGRVTMLVAQRLDQGRESELSELAPEAIEFTLGPYLGAGCARQIARRDP